MMKVSGLIDAFLSVCIVLVGAAATLGIAFAFWAITPVLIFFSWNKGIAPVFSLPEITMLQSFMISLFLTVVSKMFTQSRTGEKQ